MRSIGRALLSALLLLTVPALANDISNGSYSTTDGGNNASPPNGFPAGMFPNQLEPTNRSVMGATKRWWERANAGLTTTGSAGAYVLTPTNTSYPTAYTQGEIYCAKANFTSVGNDTLNVNSLGAKPIYAPSISSSTNSISKIGASGILTGQQFCASYDGALNAAAGGFQLQSPRTGSFGGMTTVFNGSVSLGGTDTGITAQSSFQSQGVTLMVYIGGQDGAGPQSWVYMLMFGTASPSASAVKIAEITGAHLSVDFTFTVNGSNHLVITAPYAMNNSVVIQQVTG